MDLGVVVGVEVDEAGRDDAVAGVEYARAFRVVDPTDLGHAAVLDTDASREGKAQTLLADAAGSIRDGLAPRTCLA